MLCTFAMDRTVPYVSFFAGKVLLTPRISRIAPQISSLLATKKVTGCLLFGSVCTSEGDENSDIDLICVVSQTAAFEHFLITDVLIEIRFLTKAELFSEIKSRDIRNNNLVLNAITSGVILFDYRNELAGAKELAHVIRTAGPSKLSAVSFDRIRREFTASLKQIERLSQRPDALSRGLLDIRLGQVFCQGLYAYFVVRNLWSSSVPWMLDWLAKHDHCLYTLAVEFLNLPAREKYSALQAIVAYSCQTPVLSTVL